MLTSNNVVSFPKQPSPDNKLPQETERDIMERQQEFIQIIVDELVVTALRKFHDNGFHVKNEDFINDFTFAVETLKATLYRRYNIQHSLHPMMDKAIEELNRVSNDYKE